MRSVLAAIFVLASFAASADPAATALNFADTFVVPRYQAVATAAHAQQDAWAAFCADPRRGKVETLKTAFGGVADAWARIEFVRLGPAAVALRVERFNWWLDRTNATGKALDAMLASNDAPTPQSLSMGSVAGQGLPIVERLLYAPDAPLKGKEGARRCAIGLAVSRGQAVIADAIAADWVSARAALAANTRWQVAFSDAKEAADVMLTDLAAGLEGLKDNKVAMVFHDATNANAPRLAEGVFSGRTSRDIALNLASIREALSGFLANASAADKHTLDRLFDDAAASLNAMDDAKPDGRAAAAQHMLTAFTALSQTAIAVLPQATGLNLGFNNLDGD